MAAEYKTGVDGEPEEIEVMVKSSQNETRPHSVTERHSKLPVMFERSSKSWWEPKFDSVILEKEYRLRSDPQLQRRFRYALVYVIFSCIVWCLFFGVARRIGSWLNYVIGTVVLTVIVILIFGFTFARVYRRFMVQTSLVLSVLLCIALLLNFHWSKDGDRNYVMSPVGSFTMAVEVIIMMYTVIPMPLYLCGIVGILFSIIFEILSGMTTKDEGHFALYVTGRVLLHVCIHLIGIYICVMSQVRKRSTFLKVGQSIMSRRDLEIEKDLKKKMINSLMPEEVAKAVIQSREETGGEDDDGRSSPKKRHSKTANPTRGQMTFRNFHMSQMNQVSILFADIVGFTKMSSNKTAEHLVSLLNDLFGRFDIICEQQGCEKISTLGDCYYAVSGCPLPRDDHAHCCVEMGLCMCVAIQEFDRDHNEEVNMRVGVHTGTVLCGLVGTRRFKFDTWSHDVTIANTMESEGRAGLVHISEPTYTLVQEEYNFEEGEPVEDIRKHKTLIEFYNPVKQEYDIKHVQDKDSINTYFIIGRKSGIPLTQPVNGILTPETVHVNVDKDKETTQNDSNANSDDAKNSKNHSDAQPHLADEEGSIPCVSGGGRPVLTASPVAPARSVVSSTPAVKLPTPEQNKGATPPRNTFTPHFHFSSPILLYQSTDSLKTDGIPTTALLSKREVASSVDDVSTTMGDVKLQLCQFAQTEALDQDIVVGMRKDSQVEEYLYNPPINRCTLNFMDEEVESQYREHYLDDQSQNQQAEHRQSLTLSRPRVSALLDIVVSFLFLILISTCCFIVFSRQFYWYIFFALALTLEIVMLLTLITNLFVTSMENAFFDKLGRYFTMWYPRHIIGAVVASLPVAAVYCNFMCSMFDKISETDLFYCLILVVSLLHYCNFTMLSSWMKSVLATAAGLALICLIFVGVCGMDGTQNPDSTTASMLVDNASTIATVLNETTTNAADDIFHGSHPLRFEIILSMFLLLVLIWFLNREFEISYRLAFHGDIQAEDDKRKMQDEKEQADWLLHNIIPEHVSEVLKKTSQYCKNHEDVGVIFAKIVNFESFYDESFEGGKEYLRVLNELMGDFEDLFDDPRFKDVEKIKTIGACLMVASGLNPQTRKQNEDPNAHLYALLDFSVELLKKLELFNAEIFNFNFEMAIGYNHGPVTAGVIGTTKLLYDIWGDTVNVASRMYSTGMNDRIQATEECAKKVEKAYEFEYRGQTFVKGKGHLNTYLLKGKKPNVSIN